jgi:hypothetical protein
VFFLIRSHIKKHFEGRKHMLKNRSLIGPDDFTVAETDELLGLAGRIVREPGAFSGA